MMAYVARGRRFLGLVAVSALVGCGPQVALEGGESGNEDTGTATGAESSGSGPSTVDPDTSGGPVPTVREVDIVFVVDNSGSMGEEQGKLVTAIGNLVGVLDGAEPPVDYRIAVTTTDNGNPWCQGTTPEGGAFRAISCRDRAAEFVFQGAETIDAFDVACGEVCSLESLELPDPWIDVQVSSGTTNVPGDVVIDALRCIMPQGINGCGFEQPLESLRKAIVRTETEGEAQFGFRRDGALLAAAIVTDEVDCSHNADHELMFLPDGNRIFWSNPEDPAPTSAVCWNAGVACTGSGNPYDECHAMDYDIDGNAVVDPETQAVLHPVIRYTTQLAERGAYVIAIDGVASGGTAVYSNGDDPDFVRNFGIGPGCVGETAQALPPVRIRDVLATVSDPGSQLSICDDGFEGAMNSFANGIIARLP